MLTEDEVDNFRNVMVRAINPCICILGCLANVFNMIIFTRKHMRSSTNVYLTALAFADFVYLAFSLLELFNYYRFTHFYLPTYFHLYSIIVWLKEAFSYISIGITVCFTIERFVAVRYPIHRQRYCTEVNAKRLIIAIFLICIIGTLSKPFEYIFEYKIKGYDATTDEYCDDIVLCRKNYTIEFNDTIADPAKSFVLCKNSTEPLGPFTRLEYDNCKQIDYYRFSETELHNNKTYVKIYTCIVSFLFVVIPVLVLIVFNTMLIIMVQEASQLRKNLTNAPQIKRRDSSEEKKGYKDSMSLSQENKITIVLISVVIVFLICQIPWAIFIFLVNFTTTLDDTTLQYFIAIILNTLVDINSAVNFILYCGLSEEYRTTAKRFFREITSKSRATSSAGQKSNSTVESLTNTAH